MSSIKSRLDRSCWRPANCRTRRIGDGRTVPIADLSVPRWRSGKGGKRTFTTKSNCSRKIPKADETGVIEMARVAGWHVRPVAFVRKPRWLPQPSTNASEFLSESQTLHNRRRRSRHRIRMGEAADPVESDNPTPAPTLARKPSCATPSTPIGPAGFVRAVFSLVSVHMPLAVPCDASLQHEVGRDRRA